MALPYFSKYSTTFSKKECKYCGGNIFIYHYSNGSVSLEYLKSQIGKHIISNGCLSKYRESRLGNILD